MGGLGSLCSLALAPSPEPGLRCGFSHTAVCVVCNNFMQEAGGGRGGKLSPFFATCEGCLCPSLIGAVAPRHSFAQPAVKQSPRVKPPAPTVLPACHRVPLGSQGDAGRVRRRLAELKSCARGSTTPTKPARAPRHGEHPTFSTRPAGPGLNYTPSKVKHERCGPTQCKLVLLRRFGTKILALVLPFCCCFLVVCFPTVPLGKSF